MEPRAKRKISAESMQQAIVAPNEILERLDGRRMDGLAHEAAALIREMREMLRKAVEPYHDDEHPCMCCRMLVTHAPDCKLAQMWKD